MHRTLPLAASLAAVEAIERTPLAEQYSLGSTYEILQGSAREFGDRAALVFLPQGKADEPAFTVSYAELLAKTTQAANLFHRLGMGPADVVAYVLPNLPQTHYTIWGGEAAGIVCAINPLLEPAHIADLLRAARAKVLVTLAPSPASDLWQKVAAIAPAVPTLETVLQVDLRQYFQSGFAPAHPAEGTLGGVRVLDFDRALVAEPADRLASGRTIAPTDRASYFHTGGTTGAPKIAVHTHANEVFMAWVIKSAVAMNSGHVFLCGLPLFHVNGVMVTGLANFLAGATVLLAGIQGYRTPGLLAGFWKLIEKYRVNYFSAVPTIYTALLDVPSAGCDLSSLTYALCGAAPMPPEVFRRFEALTGVKILEGYGLTEGTTASSINPAAGERRVGSIGLRLPYQQIKTGIVGGDGAWVRDCAPGEIGNLLLSGPMVFPGYLREKDNVGIWAAEGWLNTGDLARLDADGYLWLTGRAKDLIIRGGHNIDPQVIEETLCRHPAVALAAAVGQPDAYAGEIPVAYVVLRAGATATAEELLGFAREHIAERAAVPARIVVLPTLPVTAVGKIFKPELRHRAIEHVLGAALAERGIAARISVGHDERRGTLAQVALEDRARVTEARELLGSFAVACDLA